MKRIPTLIAAAMLLCSLAACGEKDNDNSNNNGNDTISGATTHEDNMAEGRIGLGTFVDYSGTALNNVYGIDFDKDGNLEFRISDDHQYISYVWSENGNNIVNADGEWDIVEPLTKGASVNSSCRWDGQGDAMLPANLPEKFYVGFRFRLHDAIHYGWAKVKYENNNLEWDECAYNTVPSATAICGED